MLFSAFLCEEEFVLMSQTRWKCVTRCRANCWEMFQN